MSLSLVNCWLSPSNDGTCEESIEYELEKEHITLYNVIISITLLCVSGNVFFPYSDALRLSISSEGSYPTVTLSRSVS